MQITTNHEKVLEGIEQGLEILEATYGAAGANVCVIEAGNSEVRTLDDGVRAIERFRPSDTLHMQGVSYLIDAARAQHRSCGDGTSTCSILAGRLIQAGIAQLKSGRSIRHVVNDLTLARFNMVSAAQELSKMTATKMSVRDKAVAVAGIAMHGNWDLGEMIGGVVAEIGPDGMVIPEPSKDRSFHIRKATGYSWKSGVLSEDFLQGGRAVYDDALVVVASGTQESAKDPMWTAVFDHWDSICRAEGRTGKNAIPLVIIVPDANGSFLATMTGNARNGFPFVVVKAPIPSNQSRDMMRDLAQVCCAEYMDDAGGKLRSTFNRNCFGRIKRISATKTSTTIQPIDDVTPDVIDGIVGNIRLIQDTLPDDSEGSVVCRERILALKAATAVIEIPVESKIQFDSQKEIIEDGWAAAMNVFDGVLPGGGAGLIAAYTLDGYSDTPSWVLDAAEKLPESQFANSYPGGVFPGRTMLPTVTFDYHTELGPDALVDASEECTILDPLETIVNAIENAFSVAIPAISTKVYVHYH